MQSIVSRLALVIVGCASACATSTELGLLQHSPGEGTGGSLTGHFGLGAVEHEVLAVSLYLRDKAQDVYDECVRMLASKRAGGQCTE